MAVLGNLLLLSSLLLFLVSFIKVIHRAQEECALLYSSEPPRNLLHMQISGPTSDLLTQKLGGWQGGGVGLCAPCSNRSSRWFCANWFRNLSSNTKCSVESREGALVAHSVLCGTMRKFDRERLTLGWGYPERENVFLLHTRGKMPPLIKWSDSQLVIIQW